MVEYRPKVPRKRYRVLPVYATHGDAAPRYQAKCPACGQLVGWSSRRRAARAADWWEDIPPVGWGVEQYLPGDDGSCDCDAIPDEDTGGETTPMPAEEGTER